MRQIQKKATKNRYLQAAQRNASLDVLRVLCMFMIVTGHCILHGGIFDELAGDMSINYVETKILYNLLQVHVNCFVLISGYFLCTSTFKLSKWIKLWGCTLFYSVLLFIILCATGNAVFSITEMVKSCLPFSQQRYWFVTTYLLMYILSPICNAAIANLTQKQHLMGILGFFSNIYLLAKYHLLGEVHNG